MVYLIDFGHAQKIGEARWSRGTDGFEAPEIQKQKLPCTTQTDAFSVGKTILAIFTYLDNEEFQGTSEEIDLLRTVDKVCSMLTEPDPESRWSLTRAYKELEPHLVPRGDGSDDKA